MIECLLNMSPKRFAQIATSILVVVGLMMFSFGYMAGAKQNGEETPSEVLVNETENPLEDFCKDKRAVLADEGENYFVCEYYDYVDDQLKEARAYNKNVIGQ